MIKAFPYLIAFAAVVGWYFYTHQTYGPATVEELFKMDLARASKVVVIAENKDIAQTSDVVKAGFIWGTQKGFHLVGGYKGDIEVHDAYGNVIGGVTNGKRWIKD